MPDEEKKLRVFKHTIPYFVPLKRLEARFLKKSVKTFSDCVHEYCRAYTARRAMVTRLKQVIDPSITDLVTSDAFDYVIFRKHYRGYPFEIRLIYETPRDTMPSRCTVFVDDGVRKRRIENAEKPFRKYPLHIAYRISFKDKPQDQVPALQN